MATDDSAAEFREAALRMKAADKALMPLVRRNIRAVTKPVTEAIRAEAQSTLPKTGGLNEWVAGAKISTSVLTGTRTAGVRLRASRKGHNLREIDQGVVRHPLYGNRDHWYTTNVPPGFFSRPVEAATPAVAKACMEALRETARIAGFK